MKRGVIKINQDVLKVLAEYIEKENDFHPLTVAKITSAIEHGESPTDLQLSESEVETLLDMLPPPVMDQNLQQQRWRENQARLALSQFLTKLKFGEAQRWGSNNH